MIVTKVCVPEASTWLPAKLSGLEISWRQAGSPGVSRISRFEAGPPRHVVPSWPAKSSRRHHEEIVKFRNHLTVIEPIGDYPESQGLGFCNRSLAGFAVTHDSRQIENVCEPPAVVFLLNFYPHGPAPQIAGLRIGFPPQPSLASLALWKVDSWVTTPNPRLVATAGRQSFIRTSNRKREPPRFRGQDASGYLRRRATAAVDRGQLVGRGLKDVAVVMGLHELAPVGGWAAGGRDGRRCERFTQVGENLPDRPRLWCNAISRMSPPHAGHSGGNSSPTRAMSFAHAIRDVSCERGF